jgi:hypothetical protein
MVTAAVIAATRTDRAMRMRMGFSLACVRLLGLHLLREQLL